jgi:hypothetical protein
MTGVGLAACGDRQGREGLVDSVSKKVRRSYDPSRIRGVVGQEGGTMTLVE